MFKKAERENILLRMAICGPTGSGKTFTALRLGSYLAKKMNSELGVIDTERKASVYADKFSFSVDELYTYEPARGIASIEEATKAGIKVLLMDSMSHFWMGQGGMLDIVDDIAKRNAARAGGRSPDSFAAWKEGTPIQRKFVESILTFPGHIIVTLRSEMEYERTTGADGRTKIEKLGLQPIQRKGLEYEFDLVMDMDIKHIGMIGKSRSDELADHVELKPGEELAEKIWQWLNKGKRKEIVNEIPQDSAESNHSEFEAFCREVDSRENLKELGPLFNTLPNNGDKEKAINYLVQRSIVLAQSVYDLEKLANWMRKKEGEGVSFGDSSSDLSTIRKYMDRLDTLKADIRH